MTTCPSCGAQNDPANRFCDQCGTRIEPQANVAAIDPASQPTAAASTCPSCGAVVLPGEAFCESCGASLQNTVTAAPADAPTVFAPPAVASANGDSAPGAVICPMCGHQNMPGDRFCDNCGANLQATPTDAAAVPAPPASPSDATVISTSYSAAPVPAEPPAPANPPVIADEAEVAPPLPAEEAATPVAVAATPVPIEAAPPLPAEETPPVASPTPDAAPPEPAPVAAASAPAASADYTAEVARLEGIVAQQRQVIGQLEQTQAVLGALTPAAILQTLDDARATLAQAEGDLQALPPPAPAVDPAEVARLEGIVAQQRQVIGQLEQTQAVLGALTPAAILQTLDDARATLAQAEGDLQALTGGTAAPVAAGESTTTAAQPTTTVPATAAAAPTPAADELPLPAAEQPVATVAPVVATPVAPPPPAGPRLVVVEGSTELKLPTDRSEIVVGREDPISQIFPEVDLTPFGGETGGVSRQHARLSHSNGQWMVTDLNSTNYTRVDGARIEPNKPTPISDGARLQFGRIAVVFHI